MRITAQSLYAPAPQSPQIKSGLLRHHKAGLLDGLLELLYIGCRAYRHRLARQVDVDDGIRIDALKRVRHTPHATAAGHSLYLEIDHLRSPMR